MRRHEQLLENYEDAYFALLMEKVAEQEGERLEKLNQQLLNDPAFAVPEATDRRCLKTIEKCFAHQQRRTTLRVVARVLHIAAIIVAISVLIFTSAFAVSEDFRVATRNLLITVSERYTDFRMETANQGGNSNQLSQNKKSDSFFDYLEVGWIPEGFQLSKSEYNHWVLYENEDSEWVQILFANDIPDLLSGISAYAADRCRSFIGSIRPQADEGNLGVIFRGCLCPGQGIDLVVGAVLFLDDAIVVLGVQRPIFYAVQHLLLFGFSQYDRQGIAEIHSTDFLTLCGADLCFLPYGVIPHTPANGKALFL